MRLRLKWNYYVEEWNELELSQKENFQSKRTDWKVTDTDYSNES